MRATKKKSRKQKIQEVMDRLDYRRGFIDEIEEDLLRIWTSYQAQPNQIYINPATRQAAERAVRRAERILERSITTGYVKRIKPTNRVRRSTGK